MKIDKPFLFNFLEETELEVLQYEYDNDKDCNIIKKDIKYINYKKTSTFTKLDKEHFDED